MDAETLVLKPVTIKNIDDDEVLSTMTRLMLPASDLRLFRIVRHYLTHSLPECCLIFSCKISVPFQTLMISPKKVFKVLKKYPEHRFAHLCLYYMEYVNWFDDLLKPKVAFGYTPCPRCVLERNIYQLPEGCPCCLDRAQFPDNKDLTQEDAA